jgi:hypothetical protein
MDIFDDPTLLNGDFNLINEISDDYEKSYDLAKNRPIHTELMFTICIGRLNSEINKPNRVDHHDKTKKLSNPWVYKKDRVEHMKQVEIDYLNNEVEEQETDLFRDLEYQNYITDMEYPDMSSLDPRDYVKCFDIDSPSDKFGSLEFDTNNTFAISNMYLEFKSVEPIELYYFLMMLTNFELYVEQNKVGYSCSHNRLGYNFLPDIIHGLITDFDFNPDVNTWVIKFSNLKFFQNKKFVKLFWTENKEIFDIFRIKLYIYGRYIDSNILKTLYLKDKINLELYSEKELVKNYVSGSKYTIKYDIMLSYTQIFGFVIKKELTPEEPNELISIKTIEIVPNGMTGLFYGFEDWVVLDFYGIKVYLLALDPMLKDFNIFKKYLQGQIDYDHVSGVNLSRIDNVRFIIKLNTQKPIDICIFNIGIDYI